MDPFSLVSYPNQNKASSPQVRCLTNNSQNLFTVLTNIWIWMYLLITKSIVTVYKHILMTFSYVFRTEEVTPHDFLFCQNSTSWLRLHHPPSFFAENLWVGTFYLWGRDTQLPFSLTNCVARGQGCCLKASHMEAHEQKREKPCEQNMSTLGPWWHSSGTLLPFLNVILLSLYLASGKPPTPDKDYKSIEQNIFPYM